MALIVVALVVPLVAVGGAAVGAKACGATVKVTDHEKYVINQYAQDGMRFAPDTVTLESVATRRSSSRPAIRRSAQPSIVKRVDLPRTPAQMQSCTICKKIKAYHVGDPTLPAGLKNRSSTGSPTVARRLTSRDSIGISRRRRKVLRLATAG